MSGALLCRATLIAAAALPLSCGGSAGSETRQSPADPATAPAGSNDAAPPSIAPPEPAPSDAAASEPVRCAPALIDSQAALDALEGCEIATTSIVIDFPGADLRPLHALRVAARGITVGLGVSAISSLAGLENLERAPIALQGVLVEDLRSLRNLKSLASGEEPLDDGALTITDCPNLKSLDGLDQLGLGAGSVTIAGNPLLTSLSPLIWPREAGFIELHANPSLHDISALQPVEHAEYLRFREMPQTTLDDFAALRSAEVIEIDVNPALEDVSGISGVESVWTLSFYQNPVLRSLPAFPRLSRASAITVWGNGSLERIFGFPVLDSLLGFDPEGVDGGELQIVDNARLGEVELGPTLAVTNALELRHNPVLVSFDLGTLDSVNARLVVTSNPRLEPSTLARLEVLPTLSRKIAANTTDAVPLDPCPWTVDRACDEAPVDGVCALGTDAADCSTDLQYIAAHGPGSSE